MYPCGNIDCPNTVAHLGQLCLACQQEDDDEDSEEYEYD